MFSKECQLVVSCHPSITNFGEWIDTLPPFFTVDLAVILIFILVAEHCREK
jgi:hypothetical protein